MVTLPYLSPIDARQRQADGALMVDIRQTAEFQRERIAQSRLYSLGEHVNAPSGITLPVDKTVIFLLFIGRTPILSAPPSALPMQRIR